MSHIESIKIEGLMGRDSIIDIALNRGVNIFFGENGCGKTTLLKLLDSALSLDSVAASTLPVRKAEIHVYSIDSKQIHRQTWERPSKNDQEQLAEVEALRSTELIKSEDPASARVLMRALQRLESRANWKVTPPTRPGMTHWLHTFLPTTRLYFGERLTGRNAGRAELSEEDLDKLFKDSLSRMWLQFYSEKLVKVRAIQETGLTTILADTLSPAAKNLSSNTEIDPAVAYRKAKTFLSRQAKAPFSIANFAEFKKKYESNPELRRVVSHIDQIETAIESTMAPVQRFVDTITNLFSKGKRLELSHNELNIRLQNDNLLSISSLSSGEKHLVKILLAVISAGPNAVLIDEPELSMHIDWQRVFVKTCRSLNPDCQLILASHSPEIMADVPDECIFKL